MLPLDGSSIVHGAERGQNIFAGEDTYQLKCHASFGSSSLVVRKTCMPVQKMRLKKEAEKETDNKITEVVLYMTAPCEFLGLQRG
jgi:hypothetical protein